MKVVRCMKCGGRPLETHNEYVSGECRCPSYAWVEVDICLAFVWDEVEI